MRFDIPHQRPGIIQRVFEECFWQFCGLHSVGLCPGETKRNQGVHRRIIQRQPMINKHRQLRHGASTPPPFPPHTHRIPCWATASGETDPSSVRTRNCRSHASINSADTSVGGSTSFAGNPSLAGRSPSAIAWLGAGAAIACVTDDLGFRGNLKSCTVDSTHMPCRCWLVWCEVSPRSYQISCSIVGCALMWTRCACMGGD